MNQVLITGQTGTLTLGSPQQAGDPPGHVYISPPAANTGLELGGPAVNGWAATNWREDKEAGTGTADVTVPGGLVSEGSTLWVNSKSGLCYRAVFDTALPPAPAAKPPVTVGADPALPTLPPGSIPSGSIPTESNPAAPVMVQSVKIFVSHEAPCTITQAALTLGEGSVFYPNVMLTPDCLGPGTTFALSGTVPYPLPGFSAGEAVGVLTYLADGVYQSRTVIVALLGVSEMGEGETN